MPNYLLPLRGSCPSALALFAPLFLLARLAGQSVEPSPPPERPSELEALIVSALQVPRDPAEVTSAVSVLDPVALQSRGIRQLREALNEVPGVISTSTSGQTGAVGSLFMRGTTTRFAQVVMDGMRLSDSNNQLGHILGAGHVYDLGRVEVLRGPQGAIYGGESIGGVLWMETPRGAGAPSGATTVEAGAFESFASHAFYQGETGGLSYYLSGGYEETDNDAPDNHFRQANTALRIEGKAGSKWTVGTTFRANHSTGEDLDTLFTFDSESRVESALGTLYAIGKISDCWTARFHAGYYEESYGQRYSYDDWYSGLPARTGYFTELRAASLSTDHEITLGERLRLLAGAFLRRDSYQSTISNDRTGNRYGAHSTLEWDVLDNLITTASLRWENYDAYGDELTWRLGTSYQLGATGTRLRAGVGSSFQAPSYMELFGSAYTQGNPDLEAEAALGWDVGIEQQLGANHLLEITWFQNQISDAITYPTFYDPPVNLAGHATTRGLELGLRGSWDEPAICYRLAWTWLHEALANSGQPRHAATASLDWKPTTQLLVGIGATHLSSHSWGGVPLPSQTVCRIYGSYQINEVVGLHARLENALNESYQLFNGYGSVAEGAGSALYAGLTVAW